MFIPDLERSARRTVLEDFDGLDSSSEYSKKYFDLLKIPIWENEFKKHGTNDVPNVVNHITVRISCTT